MADEARERATFFDHLYRQKRTNDVDFFRDQATRVDGPVLELGCGTGRIYLTLLRAGVDADGLDVLETNLALLREMTQEEGLEPSVWQGDMTSFTAEREYALVICPFNTFLLLLTHEDQRKTLECVYDALLPGGTFVFDVFVPSFDVICETYGEWETGTVEYRGAERAYRTRVRLVDEVRQEIVVEYEVSAPDGEELFSSNFRMTLLPYSELELLAESSPFESWTVNGDYADEQLADGDRVQVWSLYNV